MPDTRAPCTFALSASTLRARSAHSRLAAQGACGRPPGIGVGCRQFERAGLVALRRGKFSRQSARQHRPAFPFLKTENPAQHDGHLIRGVLRMRQHRNLAPDLGAALAHAPHAGIQRTGLTAILCRDVHERRTDELLLHCVAVEAVARFHQRQARIAGGILPIGTQELRC